MISSSKTDCFECHKMGIGTWAWGDRLLWGYGRDFGEADVENAFEASIEAGIRLFDTAEIYGQGRSEKLLGQLCKSISQDVMIASKFMPYPWRLTKSSFISALKQSLRRLNMDHLGLYQIHWPLPPVRVEAWMEGMAEAINLGLIQHVGVSNFNRNQTRRAFLKLSQFGIPLASNQVEYHLLNRKIELNGLLSLCTELGVKVISYSPLAQGLLTGKYFPGQPPPGLRGRRMDRKHLAKIQSIIALMKKIGAAHDGKTPAQVALNWTIKKGTLPIPGVKNAQQVVQNVGALGWVLTDEEVAALDDTSDKIHETFPH